MPVLVLGGTGNVWPHVVSSAQGTGRPQARGHLGLAAPGKPYRAPVEHRVADAVRAVTGAEPRTIEAFLDEILILHAVSA